MSRRTTLLVLSLTLALCACSSIDRISANAAFMQTSVDGHVALGPSTGPVSLDDRKNYLSEDLGVEQSNPGIMLGANATTSIGRFGAAVFWFEDTGSGTLAQPFGDLPAGTAVNSEFDFRNLKTYWVYDILELDGFRLAPGVAVNFIDTQTKARSATVAGNFEEAEVFAPIPLLYVDSELELGMFRIQAQAGGIKIDLGDGEGVYWDLDGRVGFAPVENVDIFAGYRYLTVDASGDARSRDAQVDLRVSGWFLGGEIRF
jgi:hypothetical protein